MEPQKPSVGRIVHFNNNGEMEAALVVRVDADAVNLIVWGGDGSERFESSVAQGTESGSWQWPARV